MQQENARVNFVIYVIKGEKNSVIFAALVTYNNSGQI